MSEKIIEIMYLGKRMSIDFRRFDGGGELMPSDVERILYDTLPRILLRENDTNKVYSENYQMRSFLLELTKYTPSIEGKINNFLSRLDQIGSGNNLGQKIR